MEFNVSRVCRVCMQDGVYDILTSIFANDDYSQTYISNKIMACAAVEVHEGDGLPSLICHKCTEKVNIAYQFKQECESSDQVLRELIEKNSKGAIFQNYRPSSTPQVDQSVTQNVTDVNVLLKLESLNADLGAEMEIANNETVGNDDFDSSHDSIDDEQYIDTINDPTSIVYELNIDNNVFEENNTTTEETITDEMIPNAEMNAVVDNKQEQPLKRRTRRLPKKLASDNEEEPVAVRKKSIKIKCRVCGVSMSSNSMSMHMKKVHNEQAVFCKICLKQFSEKTGLAGHMKSHAKTKLCCQVCEAVFFSPAKLYLHMQRIHHNIEQQAVILGSIEQDLLAINTKKSKPRKHVCHCGHAVLTPAKLAVHMRTHSRERPFLCTLCPKNFSEKSSLASHMLTHGGQKNFHCKDCGRGFTHSSALRIHQRIHNGELPHTCSHCQRRFRSSGDMNEHIRRAHTFERPFCCRYCKLTFVSSSDLARHTRRHTSRPVKTNNKSKAETITVNQQIENDSNYEQQYNLQQPQHELLDNENIFNLHTFESNLEHLYIKHDLGKDNTSTMKTKAKTKRSKSSRLICEVCGKALHSTSRLDIHMRSHTNEKPFSCQLCYKTFTESAGLSKHMTTHSGKKDFVCETCDKGFSSRAARKNHMLIHTGELPFPCFGCVRKFRTKQCLEEHVRRAHTFEKPFACDVCDKTFISSNQLILHRRVHTGERPYQCNVCQLTFRTQDAAKIHLRRHLGEKKFVCGVCNMGFVSTGELKRHELKHTGVKKYECTVCSRKFARGDKLLYHMTRLHNKPKEK